MRFGVLGPLAVWTADGSPVQVPELKVRALLADLLVHEGRPVSAARLLDDLWGEQLPGNPGNTLQTKVSQLRRALENGEPGGRELVAHQPAGYQLLTGADAVDVGRFRTLTAQAMATDDPRVTAALLSDALTLWRGPALADFAAEPFAEAAIRRLEEERLVAVEERAQARLALGGHAVAALVGELGDLVALHPLRERLRGLQMRALYQAGRQGEALSAFAELRKRLVEELGLEPGPEITALQQAVLAQDRALDSPPAQTRPRTNLATPLTELVGRSAAVAQVRSLLRGARLVTLTGPGGVGKTRLAAETARQLADAGRDGVWMVELAGVDPQVCPDAGRPTGDELVEVIAAALGVRQDSSSGAPLVDRLGDALRAENVLLVLDNCEQVIGPVATVAQRLLRAVPGLRILATSREPLGLTGEALFTVPPLELPERAAEGRLDAVRDAGAVQLFVARAGAAAPGFVLDGANAAAVAAICRRLDGIPLALELAATRVRALGVHTLLERLDDRFRLLATGARGAPARQQTLRAMIGWSWDLLTAAEQIVLRRLAVHAEGATLDAAESVCAGEGVRPGDVLDLLARLVDRSLVVSHEGPDGPRFRLLETVAAYCVERMADAGETEILRRRHSRYYLALAERAEPELRGPEQRRWLERLDADSADIRAALDHLAQQTDGAEPALRLVNAMTWYWFLRGRLGEASRSVRRALSLPGDASAAVRAHAASWQTGLRVLDGESTGAEPDPAQAIDDPAVRARARWFVGHAAGTIGDLGPGERLVESSLAAFRAVGDRWGIAAALADRVTIAISTGDLARGRVDAELSAELFREVGDRWGQAQASYACGTLAEIAGDYELAARRHRDGLRMAEELGLWAEVSYQLSWLGRIALLTGRLVESRELHEQALRMAVEHGFTPGRIYAATGLALVARRCGELDVAQAHLLDLLAWHRGGGGELASTLILAELGFVAELRGDAAEATTLHLDGLVLARRVGDPRATALAMEGLAGAAALGGEPFRAARLLGAAAAARAGVGAPLPAAERGDVDRITAAARAALGEAGFTAAFERGAELDPGELVPEASDRPVDGVRRDPELVPGLE